MDVVTAVQFRILKESFARKGVEIDAAYTPAGDIDYIYVVDRLLVRAENVERLQAEMPGLRRVDDEEQPDTGDVVRLATDRVRLGQGDAGSLAVPELLDVIDERLRISPEPTDDELPATPLQVLYISKITPFGEPEFPGGATGPWPAKAQPGGAAVKIGICDTGLQRTSTSHSWMANVTGEQEPIGDILPSGLESIRPYAGHGTFASGVAACTAPDATVYVNNHFTESEGEIEDVMVQKIKELITKKAPHLVCLPAGLYARKNAPSLPFNHLHQVYPNLTLVAAAGNDSKKTEKFYPAAYSWAIGVGALAPGQQTQASFTNCGSWVKVYALGEGMINAYAYGQYTYQEWPKAPGTEIFQGLAKWAGTSFSAPLVAGLIARELARLLAQNPASTAATAAQNVLNSATNFPFGKAVFPP